ncbi:ABC transporter substrate-binding protein [Lacrimispora sphenoides]|uniref:Multiple sugar transport system substrate-binding protein n=1 Tax=Lacrimispora sphenoides JCM 1415 TaxID=1297793 RepID=A0ABY1C5W7_9FIRM|nr:sugar ABC transporter substrate-binding protein [Lacrimispora sphenoides]SET71863.1 multiple sugar transport system substrate-binding protein [[Clostridium] sphenoides JCM 1415]SUY50729.1 extracellular solute-binding protein [Lacrimispora sphenoides]
MMKKQLLGTAIVIMLAMGMSGCKSADTKNHTDTITSEVNKEGQAGSEPVTITFWDENAGPTRTPYYEELIKKFEESHPGIKVEYVGLPWSDSKSKYDVAIQSGTTPDVGGITQSWLTDFIVKEAVIPLDDYFDKWDQKDDMIPGYIQSQRDCAPNGKLYAINNTANIPVVWYRPDVLEEKGIDVPKSWNDVFNTIEATTDKGNNIYGFSIRGGSGGTGALEMMMYSYSGISEMFDENGKSTVNDPSNVEFVERLSSLYNVYTPESDITNGYKEMVAAFDTRVANMIYHNLGSYGEHSKTLEEGEYAALTSIESVKGSTSLVTNGCISYSIFKTTKHPEEAFEFLSFLCENEQSIYWNQNIGQLPTTKTSLESDYVKQLQHIRAAAETSSDPDIKAVLLPIYLPGYADLHENVLPSQFQEVLLGNKTAQEFLDNWAGEMTKLKEEYDQYLTN